MTDPILFIGNKTYSSWSMRPWLALRWGGIAFEERVLPLGMLGYGPSKNPEIVAASPSGRVPALRLAQGTIWDSLAICEWAAEANPALWPVDPFQRAMARAVTAEMHAGFAALRKELPMNLRRDGAPRALSDDAKGDVARIEKLWGDALAASGGPFLFGARSIADAFYAPVAGRFRYYGVAVSDVSRAYGEALFADPEVQAWRAQAIAEPWFQSDVDSL